MGLPQTILQCQHIILRALKKVEKKPPKKSGGKDISSDQKEKGKARAEVASRETEGHLSAKWKPLKHGKTGTASGEAEEKEPKSD